MTCDGQISQLGSYYPNGGDEPNSRSTLPIRMGTNHGKSLHAHSAMISAALIRMDFSDVIM